VLASSMMKVPLLFGLCPPCGMTRLSSPVVDVREMEINDRAGWRRGFTPKIDSSSGDSSAGFDKTRPIHALHLTERL